MTAQKEAPGAAVYILRGGGDVSDQS